MPSARLEVNEDLAFQHRWWRIQRIVWVLMALLLFASLGGALGDGPLSTVRRSSADGRFEIQYERIVRSNSPQRILLSLAGASHSGLALRLAGGLFHDLQILRVEPKPAGVESFPTHLVYHFQPLDSKGPIRINLEIESSQAGRASGTIEWDSDTVSISQFVLP